MKKYIPDYLDDKTYTGLYFTSKPCPVCNAEKYNYCYMSEGNNLYKCHIERIKLITKRDTLNFNPITGRLIIDSEMQTQIKEFEYDPS